MYVTYCACAYMQHALRWPFTQSIARWTVEEHGARRRALQGVTLQAVYGLISTERAYHLCCIAPYSSVSLAEPAWRARRRGSAITAVLFIVLVHVRTFLQMLDR